MKRKFAVVENLDTIDKDEYEEFVSPTFCPEEKANLVSSRVDSEACHDEHAMHMPVIDIDLPCKLVPSRTEGHFHLYIDKPMTWRQYTRVLEALMEAGVVEPGYYMATLNHGASFVRTPVAAA